MISRTSVTFVHIFPVLRHIGFTDNDIDEILGVIGNDVTWGDAAFTLIGNTFALHLIQDACVEGDIPADDIAERFWEVVGKDDYINMERW